MDRIYIADTSIRFPNLNIDFDFVPQSVSVRGFEISIFGLLVIVGMLLGLGVMIFISKARDENPNLCLETAFFSLVGGVLGARLLYVGLHWSEFAGESAKKIMDFRAGGMYFYGGIAGAVLLGALFCRIRRISFGKMADITSMGFLTVQIIAVWGNFFNREAFGEYTDSLFAMLIPRDILDTSVVTELMSAHLVKDGEISWIQVHPLFLYKSLWYLLLFLILLFYTWKKKFDGEIFLRYLAGCFLGEAGIQWLSPRQFVIPGTEVPVLLPVYILLFTVFIIIAAVRRSLSKKREVYKIRREEERKRAALLHEDVHSFENVTEEIMGAVSEAANEKSEENEVSEDAEENQEPEEKTAAAYDAEKKDPPEETEAENTEVPQETERNDQQQSGSAGKSENKQEA